MNDKHQSAKPAKPEGANCEPNRISEEWHIQERLSYDDEESWYDIPTANYTYDSAKARIASLRERHQARKFRIVHKLINIVDENSPANRIDE